MPDTQASEGLSPQADGKPSAKYPTRELGRLLSYYKKNVRDFTPSESTGVIRAIQRMIDKGIGLEDIAQALRNYAEDEYRKSQDTRFSHAVRTFFSEAKIKEWLEPKQKRPFQPSKPSLPQIDFKALERPKPVIPQAAPETLEEDIEL